MKPAEFGFVFEIGIIAGMLTAIHQLTEKKKILSDQHTVYLDDLKSITIQRIQQYFRTNAEKDGIINPEALNKLEKFSEYLIFSGTHKGYHFMMEYHQSMQNVIRYFHQNPLPKDTNTNTTKIPQLLYYQCDLQQLFRENRNEKREVVPRFQDLLNRGLNLKKAIAYGTYSRSGEFLQADIIMLWQLYDRYRIVVIDVSSFLTKETSHIPDMRHPTDVKKRLQAIRNYLREKSAFEQLAIDTEGNYYEKELNRFIRAFVRKDKEVYKIIQASSYAYSFYSFLKDASPALFESDRWEFNALGLTDRADGGIFVSQKENIAVLKTCQEIYKNGNFQEDVNAFILKNFKRTFQKNDSQTLHAFVSTLQTTPDKDSETKQAVFREKLTEFMSTADNLQIDGKVSTIRDGHAALVTQALDFNNELIFLTGHPGIGKTTAVVEYLLREQILAEGFIFFYISPRIQVNRDIIEKFRVQDKLRSDNLICIHTDSVLIKNNGEKPIVKYVCNEILPPELAMPPSVAGENKTGVLTLMLDEEEQVFRKTSHYPLKSVNDGRMAYRSRMPQGVLNTICSAVCTLRVRHQEGVNIPRNIVATVTTQSLRSSVNGARTTDHIRKIFADAMNKRTRAYNHRKMSEISRVNKHIIFMVDEIIGDHSGVQFIHDLVALVEDEDLRLRDYFNLKIVAADASIVGKDVIEQHLTEVEPSPGKILYRHVVGQKTDSPLSMESNVNFSGSKLFKRFKATVINANTFPARDLALTYKVSATLAQAEVYKFDEGQQAIITQDVLEMLQNPAIDGQIIVYIQDIQRLSKLINEINKQLKSFKLFEDYLEIHSGIEDRDKILTHKDKVRIIFMTASASRGVTFPGVRHILLEIPRFQVEQNLMEIIQTVYRGRGGETADQRALEKQTRYLTFYFHTTIYYGDENQRESRYRGGIISVLNMILLTRAALKTRIQGHGNIGRQPLKIIPVGEKHVSSAGGSLLASVSGLLQKMTREIRTSINDVKGKGYSDALKKLYGDIEEVFGHTRTILTSQQFVPIEQYYAAFRQQVFHGLHGLVKHDFKQAYIDGDLLTVRIEGTEEQINMRKYLLDSLRTAGIVGKLHWHAQQTQYSTDLRDALSRVAGDMERILHASEQTAQSQTVQSGNKSLHQYCSIPLPVLFSIEQFTDYFQQSETRMSELGALETHTAFYDVIKSYLWTLYPLTDILPLNGDYAKYPFLLFRCDNLSYIRQQHFDRRYLFSSIDLNVLNLLLMET